MEPFDMAVAGLLVRVRPLYGEVRELCADYLVAPRAGDLPLPPPDLDIHVTPGLIDHERARATEGVAWSDPYLETLAVLRVIAETAPHRGRLLVHGALIALDGRAYLFCAPSGTGKSTHILLWRRYLGGRVRVLNGDKPLLSFGLGGEVVAHGTPWAGKEGWNENASAPLAGICLLERAVPGESSIERAVPAEAAPSLLRHVYLPAEPDAAASTLGLADALLAAVPVFRLAVDRSEDAVRVSYEALTGGDYGSARGHVATAPER